MNKMTLFMDGTTLPVRGTTLPVRGTTLLMRGTTLLMRGTTLSIGGMTSRTTGWTLRTTEMASLKGITPRLPIPGSWPERGSVSRSKAEYIKVESQTGRFWFSTPLRSKTRVPTPLGCRTQPITKAIEKTFLRLQILIVPSTPQPMHHTAKILFGIISFVSTVTFADQLKFSIVPNFFEEKPGGQQLGPCHGGAVIDKKGNIYITTDTERGIIVFTSKGKFLRSFGPTKIHGLEIGSENGKEYIYAARPSAHEVVKLTLDGTTEWTITAPMEAGIFKDANGFNPCAVSVAPDGSIFIADGYGSNFVLKFDKNRKFVKAFGGPGEEEGKFKTCHGIGIDTRGSKPLVLVCNRNNNRVEHWDLDGNFIRVIQKDLRMPAAVSFRGDYAVFPELQGRVTVLGKDGKIVAQVGDNPEAGQRANFALPSDQWKDGICNSPHGATMDKKGNLIVSEWSKFGHLHKFKREK